ncbi:polysaccharide deacetylase family protein [Pseudomonas sp. R-28-1W-6]|uniref:polysaccharide deacetylase family protein n=1 Tax=Pseudomonas sp. R-28-1W-6 TaxID=2650101 RepID=UPI0013659DAF|nr:polysaccharide deacetylase family protein [Pseudomonas sp. R-28-1W-6]MWV12850.1 polysaccharide deacetylase family protein [Pseudomonas sp. R-28-1W-6]
MLIRTLLLGLGLLAGSAQAAGPATFATLDRGTWPEPLHSQAAFDSASRAEILMFAQALQASEGLDEAGWKTRLGLKSANLQSIAQVRERFWQRLLENYRFARQSCTPASDFCAPAEDVAGLREQARQLVIAPDSRYFAWAEASQRFHLGYLNEQMRLAALFPRISSEIALFSDQERNGDELADRQFLLTFDDGPTALGGHTDKLAAWLREQGLNGTFYVLGSNLQQRLQKTSAAALNQLYAGQCVASHGWEHKAHTSWADWQGSVSRTRELLQRELPALYLPLFRPPYGQRQADSQAFFASQGLQVALWQIDSQDWSSKVGAEAAGQRVLTLMLLWRRGVVLFHDIHNKAAGALPWLLQASNGAGVNWLDCHDYR